MTRKPSPLPYLAVALGGLTLGAALSWHLAGAPSGGAPSDRAAGPIAPKASEAKAADSLAAPRRAERGPRDPSGAQAVESGALGSARIALGSDETGLLARIRGLVNDPGAGPRMEARPEGLLALAFEAELRLVGARSAAALLDDEPSGMHLLVRGAQALEAEGLAAESEPLWRRATGLQFDLWKRETGVESGDDGDDRVFPDVDGSPFADWARVAPRDACLGLLALYGELRHSHPLPPEETLARGLLVGQRLLDLEQGDLATTHLMQLLGEFPEQLQVLRLLLKLAPLEVEAQLRRMAGADGESKLLLAEVMAEQGRDAEVLALLSSLAAEEEARQTLLYENPELARQLDPELLEAWLGGSDGANDSGVVALLLGSHTERGNDGRALDLLEGTLARIVKGEDPGWLPPVPTALVERQAAALGRYADNLRRTDPRNDEIWGDLGDLYGQLGRWNDALEAYQRAASIDPEDFEWTDALARVRANLR